MRTAETAPALDDLEPGPSGPARRAPAGLATAAAIVGGACLLPSVYLVVRAAGAGADGVVSTLLERRTTELLVRTLILAAAVTASATAIGVPLAWLTERTDLPGRRAWVLVAALPLVIPTYVGAYAFIAALGPRGLVQGWLEPLGVERLPEIYGFFGSWLVLTLFTYPYVLLTVRAALRRLDPALEEAAISLGRSRRAAFRAVVLPQLRPSIAAGGLLVALYTLHDFGAVSLMRFDTFTRGIYNSYRGSFDRSRAAVLALVLVATTLLVLGAEVRTRGRAQYYRLGSGAARKAPVLALGRWRWPAAAACAVLALIALGLPAGVIGYWMVSSARARSAVGPIVSAAINSVEAGALAALAAVAAAWPVAVLSVRFKGRLGRAAERASFVGFALPGIVVALALVFFGTRYAPALYQTLTMLVFAYVVLFLPQAIGALRSSLLQVNPHLEEAAQSLGMSRFRTVTRVVVPLVMPGLLAGAALVFLTVMKELPATLLLAPIEFRTLATEVWNATSAAFFDRAALPALGLIALSSIPLAILLAHREEERA